MLASSAFAALFLISGSYLTLSATSISLSQAMLVITAAATLALRAKMPGLARPYRAPFQPWSLWCALALNLALLGVFVIQDPFNALLGFALVAVLSAGALLFGAVAEPGAGLADTLAGADA
jgi:hypothetical protein